MKLSPKMPKYRSQNGFEISCHKIRLKEVKPLDLGRGQGAIWRKSGAYTEVREHFEADRNAAIGQEVMV